MNSYLYELLQRLSLAFGPSGNEEKVRDIILSYIEGYAPYYVDPLGNIIVNKKGKRTPEKRIMIDAHMDEVGMIITSVCDDGLLKFSTIGGILPEALLGKTVSFGNFFGVIGCLPIHCLSGEQKNKYPAEKDLFINIGAKNKEEALSLVQPGDACTFYSDFVCFGNKFIKGKALDDRVGCAILIDYIRNEQEFDTICTFTVQEEVGLIGAKTATFSVKPDIALVLEATTAADIAGIPLEQQVCNLSQGVAISFMDRATIYDKELYQTAMSLCNEKGIACQSKNAVAGGNNGGAIHSSVGGVRTLALSVPCRYLHSASCVINWDDVESTSVLLPLLVEKIAKNT